MAVTPARLQAILFLDCGIEDAAAAPVPFYDIARATMLDSIKSVLQKVYAKSPNWVSETPGGAALAAPATLTGMTCTLGSTTFGGAVPTAAQIGCTVQIAGEEFQNVITSATTLLYPFTQATGTYNGTVYTDAIHILNADGILPPVGILGGNDLIPMQSRATFGQPTRFYASDHGIMRDVPFGGMAQAGYGRSENRDIGTPCRYYVVQERSTTTGDITLGLIVDPMPDKAYTLKYTVLAPSPSIEDIDSTTPVLMPLGCRESVLIPLCRKEFSTFKHFSGDKIGIAEAAKEAWAALGSQTDVRGGYNGQLKVSPQW